MDFIADLHIHSCYSRATSRDMTLETLYRWAQIKGLTVIATGDFTHPAWYAELRDKLEPAEPGLYCLRADLADEIDRELPAACRGPVRFLLSVELSSIYKKNGRTRKVHNLIMAPDLLAAGRLNAQLHQIGNIKSDGRPILGLDCTRLLELALEADPRMVLVPAHIWTPHFSVLGAASGFESIEECFDDLGSHIFALETGLSSDPPMNWMLSALDRYTLISNSDAHSPAKLAREANLFACDLSYDGIMQALRKPADGGFRGTLEFFPEEGKYHCDGHRACGQCLTPQQTRQHGGLCPVCGRKVTIGVLNRVSALADRDTGMRPAGAPGFESLIPLEELLAELCGVGVKTKRVQTAYTALIERLGSELYILRQCPEQEVEAALPRLGTAIGCVRRRQVRKTPGYDGAYGRVTVCAEAPPDTAQLSLW